MHACTSDMRCAANLSRGLWKPALEPNASGRAAPPCTSSELFDAGLLYPRACGPRCWWQPAQEDGCGWERVSREHALYCLRDRWLVLVGDSQVRYWVRFIAHWLDGGVKLPRGNEHYYDDVDLLLNGGRTTLSYRFAGPDYGRYARALARPRQLEVFDAKRNRHSPANGSAASSLASGPHANRSTPDALLLASSFWHPSCDKLRELSRVYAEASLASLRRPDEGEPKGREPPLRLVAWALLGSHVGPLDK